MNISSLELFGIFRTTITCMSSGILLVIVGTTEIYAVIAGVFFILSFLFLVSTLGLVCKKLEKFYDKFKQLDGILSFSFVIIGLFSIINGMLNIIDKYSQNITTIDSISTFVRNISPLTIFIWFIGFGLVFVIVFFTKSIKSIDEISRIHGSKAGWITVGIALGNITLLAIIIFVAPYNYYLLILWVLLLFVALTYSNALKRRLAMERKDKARVSATRVATIAQFIGNIMTYDYPPETLKIITGAPLKQLEDELKALKATLAALK